MRGRRSRLKGVKHGLHVAVRAKLGKAKIAQAFPYLWNMSAQMLGFVRVAAKSDHASARLAIEFEGLGAGLQVR